MSKKIMSILLTLLFTSLAFLGLGEFGLFHSITGSCLLPERLSNHFQGLSLFRLAQNCIHIHCRIHHEIALGHTQQHETLYAGPNDLPVLSSAV
jgi:hypothetical protein